MNKAVFLFTFARYARPSSLLTLAFYAIGLPLLLAGMCTDEDIAGVLSPLITGPTLPMIMAYTFVQSSVANSRSINDGEYLALLFTRPITRANYAITKWIAGSIAVFAIALIQLFIFGSYQYLVFHRDPGWLFNGFVFCNLLLNAISYTALIVCIASVPMRLGITLFISLVYITFLGNFIGEMGERTINNGFASTCLHFIATACYLGKSVLLPSIDLFTALLSTKFSWLPFISYLSNVSIYLLVATVILSYREFFYAAE